MKKNTPPNSKHGFLYVREHTSCRHYVADYRSKFRIFNLKPNERQVYEAEPFNFIEFFLEGEALLTCNEFEDRRVKAGEMVFIPKGALYINEAVTPVRMIRFAFDTVNNVCDKLHLHSYWPMCAKMEYDFQPLEVKLQLDRFLETLTYYLEEGINCEHFHELKQQEIFLVLRWFYRKEELARLFYPIIGNSLDFKALVLENYLKVESVAELAELSHMGRSNFDATFKKEFGMPAGQWMLKQTAMHVKYHLSAPDATVGDVMHKFNFNSPTHFTRFCRQQFGCTPTDLITQLQNI